MVIVILTWIHQRVIEAVLEAEAPPLGLAVHSALLVSAVLHVSPALTPHVAATRQTGVIGGHAPGHVAHPNLPVLPPQVAIVWGVDLSLPHGILKNPPSTLIRHGSRSPDSMATAASAMIQMARRSSGARRLRI